MEVIFSVVDNNEITNHWLNVATAKCIRVHGVLTEDELKAAEVAENPQAKPAAELNEKEKIVYFVNEFNN